MDEQTDDLMTLTDAAKLIGCTRQNMSLLVGRGVIPSQRLAGGAVVLVKRSDVEYYASQPRNKGGRPVDPSAPRSKARKAAKEPRQAEE